MSFLETQRSRATFLIFALGVAVLIAIAPFLTGLMGAAVLYVIFAGVYRRLAQRVPDLFAAIVVLVAALILIVLPLAWLIGAVVGQAPDALRSLRDTDVLSRIAGLQLGKLQVGAEIAKASGTIVSWISGQAFSFLGVATSFILNVVVAFFGLFYLLRSDGQMWDTVREFIPFSHETADVLRERFVSVTEATLVGTVLVAALQGTVVGIGFGVAGLPSPIFWGTVAAFTSILPLLGSAIVWVPGVLVLFARGSIGPAILLIVIGGGIASNLDNLIRPLIYRRVSNVHPMITLVGAFAGVRYFGLLGVLLGPLAIGYLFELLYFYRKEYSEGDATVVS
jgi:predicted PurR-regulated permease PerM